MGKKKNNGIRKESKKKVQEPTVPFKWLYYGSGFLVLGLGMQYFGYDSSKVGNYLKMIFLWIAVVLNVVYLVKYRISRKK